MSQIRKLNEFNISTRVLNILKKEGIITDYDLLHCFPISYKNYRKTLYSDIKLDTNLTIEAIVSRRPLFKSINKSLTLLSFKVLINNNTINATIFNRGYLARMLIPNTYVRLTGKFTTYNSINVSEISFNKESNDIQPIYNMAGISDDQISKIKQIVYNDNVFIDILPFNIKNKYDLLDINEAILNIFKPKDEALLERAILRMKFEEYFLYFLNIKYIEYTRKNNNLGIKININQNKVNELISLLNFELTMDQRKALNEVLFDLSQSYKMSRLLQGEVGCGKTIIALIASYACILDSYQVAIMAPTEILASQHYITFCRYINKDDILLLQPSMSNNAREKIKEAILLKHYKIIIGTHILFSKDIVYNNLGLVITDEEHKFGVIQRTNLTNKALNVNHLKMSATPIPRTLSLAMSGGSDLSTIYQLPNAKASVYTKYIPFNDVEQVYEHIRVMLLKNKQIYVVTPLINESELLSLSNVYEIKESFSKMFPNAKINILHSKLKPQEKEMIIYSFKNNEINILVSTTIIEVGIDIPNATSIVIFDADRFGIAQLHQLRGRVRRSNNESYCFLVSNSNNVITINRLLTVERISDGFKLAEEDLYYRGIGDYFGLAQSGKLQFRFDDYDKEKIVFNKALDECINTYEKNLLKTKEYAKILCVLEEKLKKYMEVSE